MDPTTSLILAALCMNIGILALIVAGRVWMSAIERTAFKTAREQMRQAFIKAGPKRNEMQDVYLANIAMWILDEHNAGRFDLDNKGSYNRMAKVILYNMFDLDEEVM